MLFGPRENWLDFSLNQIQGWTTVREFYSRALEQGPLAAAVNEGMNETKSAIGNLLLVAFEAADHITHDCK